MRKHESLDERLLDVIRRESRSVTIRKDVGGARKVLRAFAALAQPTVSTEQYNELMDVSYSAEDGVFGALKKIFTKNKKLDKFKLYNYPGPNNETLKLLDDTIALVERGELTPITNPIVVESEHFYINKNDRTGEAFVRHHAKYLDMRYKANELWGDICDYSRQVIKRINRHVDVDDYDECAKEEEEVWDKHFDNPKFIGMLEKLESTLHLTVEGDKTLLRKYTTSFVSALEQKLDEMYPPVKDSKGTILDPLTKEEILASLGNIRDVVSNEYRKFENRYSDYDMINDDLVKIVPDDYLEYVIGTESYIYEIFYEHHSMNGQVTSITGLEAYPKYITDHFSWVMASLGK